MNELSNPTLARPLDRSQIGADVAALNDLMSILNNPHITGADVPKDVEVKATLPVPILPSANPAQPVHTAPGPVGEPHIPTLVPIGGSIPLSAHISKPDNTQQIFFTGRLKSGKDHCAAAAGCQVFGFAEPLYGIANYFFNAGISATSGKDIPGVREFLQKVGNWGRAETTPQYPLSPERASFIYLIRTLGELEILGADTGVEWSKYGADTSLWVSACIRRVEAFLGEHSEARVAITNCRHANEHKALTEARWTGWHVMCSSATWGKRLAAGKLTPESPVLKDLSEQMAARMDAQVIQTISKQKDGPKLHVIWNDPDVAPPSVRLHTVQSFLETLNVAAPNAQPLNPSDEF